MERPEDMHFELEAANIDDEPRDPVAIALGYSFVALFSVTFWAAVLYWLLF